MLYILIVLCILLGAAALMLLQLFLSTRHGVTGGLWLPAFALLLWLMLTVGLVDISSVVTLSTQGEKLVQLVLLSIFIVLSGILALSRWMRQRNILIRNDIRAEKIRIKKENHRIELDLRRREKEGR